MISLFLTFVAGLVTMPLIQAYREQRRRQHRASAASPRAVGVGKQVHGGEA